MLYIKCRAVERINKYIINAIALSDMVRFPKRQSSFHQIQKQGDKGVMTPN